MKLKIFSTIAFFILLYGCKTQTGYIKNEGYVFGTIYHFTYQSNKNLEEKIKDKLLHFNASLSTYDSTSIISRINRNDTTVRADSFFIKCFNCAKEVSELSDGAFDMTVAPVVNAWGFGFDESTFADSAEIDSLMKFVGFHKVKLVGNKIIKENPGTMLDASAIAKGQGVDLAAEYLESLGIKNYMIEIGGEVRAKGVNAKGTFWRIGIDKPIDDVTASHREIQAIVSLENKSLATSGNYRQFYEKDGIKYSHTINPKTGFPARNSLLSTSVMADNCMQADAWATAFMVLGVDKSIELSEKLKNIEVYFIYSNTSQNYQIYASRGFKEKLMN